ncbi:hypothetical protein DASC09_003720 [Saccharomycopsis crataegensis]|uniref:GH16 domain-containing protein n=1 Tax=Saccharomycopsis crataegensis TaxID=43959 RepID=A0AAV5QEK6_9ASCO|nr:hypothetical protein DASC09_003720 [Saccharomycopsis crataegensis]
MLPVACLIAAFSLLYPGIHASTANITAGSTVPALGKSINVDFSSNSSYFSTYGSAGKVEYGTENGLELTIAKKLDNPSIVSDFTIMFGRVEVICQAAPGTGIVTTLYLQSEDLDEIDIEWLGGDTNQVQSNYFSKGDTTTYDRGGYHTVSNPQTTFHNYTLDWTEDQLQWYIDGTLVRTLLSTSSEGYPQTPSKLYIGTWVGGDSSVDAAGTVEWAGGETDYSTAPWSAYFKELVVTDYSTGSSYEYTDTSGDWTSIKSNGGTILGNIDADDAAASSDASSVVSSSSATSSSAAVSSSSATSSSAAVSSYSAYASASSSAVTSSYEAYSSSAVYSYSAYASASTSAVASSYEAYSSSAAYGTIASSSAVYSAASAEVYSSASASAVYGTTSLDAESFTTEAAETSAVVSSYHRVSASKVYTAATAAASNSYAVYTTAAATITGQSTLSEQLTYGSGEASTTLSIQQASSGSGLLKSKNSVNNVFKLAAGMMVGLFGVAAIL